MESDAPWNPLGVMFSMYGSRTNSKLLFKYPFKTKSATSSKSCYQQLSSSTLHLNNPALSQKQYDGYESDDNGDMDQIRDFMEQFLAFSDDTLGQILSPGNTKICGQSFDVKINGLRFVGFPLLPEKSNLDCNRYRPLQFSAKSNSENADLLATAPSKVTKTVSSFNVVFVIKTNADYSIIESYQQLSAKIGLALRFEEQRDNYITKETKLMLNIHEDAETCTEQVYKQISTKSLLAKDLMSVFRSLTQTGIIDFHVNKNIWITFCIYHKVHNTEGATSRVSIAAVEASLNNIQPYHGILVYDIKDVWDALTPASSSTIVKFLSIYQPTKSLQLISTDADIALTHVYAIARHLVHWGKACVIYPLCETNVYALAPTASLSLQSKWIDVFQKTFQVSITQVLSNFSQPVRLGDLQSPAGPFFGYEKRLVEIVYWMLQHRFLVQHHTYVYFMPPLSNGVNRQPVLASLLDYSGGLGSEVAQYDHLPKLAKIAFDCVPAAKDTKDLALFLKLLSFMDGKHHLEEMMYRSNLMRSDLLTILEKFKPVLLTCVREDETASVFRTGT